MINGIDDQSSGICGNISEGLSRFNKGDFTNQAQTNLAAKVVPTTPHLDQVIKVVDIWKFKTPVPILTKLLGQIQGLEINGWLG